MPASESADSPSRSRWLPTIPFQDNFRIADNRELMAIGAFKGSNERLPRADDCKDEGHSDASSIKRVTSSSEDDCSVFSMKKGSLSAATKSRI